MDYNGTKQVWAPHHAQISGGEHFDNTLLEVPYHGDAVFVLCLPGDRPFTKRIYDTWSAVAIPVVLKIPCEGKTTHWRGCINRGRGTPFWPSHVDKTYPRIAGLNYSDILVEVDRDVADIIRVLEDIPAHEVERMLKRIEEVRHHFLYDFHGLHADAFTDLLRNVQLLVNSSTLVGD